MSLRRDRRRLAILVSCIAVGIGGFLLDELPTSDDSNASPSFQRGAARTADGKNTLAADPAARRAHEAFQRAVAMLRAGHFEYAVAALHDVLAIYPELPEAHANMGYALLGLDDYAAAADFFAGAADLDAELHTAYYGLALARAGLGDFGSALAAMQSFVHLADANDPYLPKAQSAMSRWRIVTGDGQ